jgi:2-methylcitrate dehydratase PrpD
MENRIVSARVTANYTETRRRYIPKSGVTRELAENVVRLEYGDIPPEVLEKTKVAILESAGQMLSGALQPGSKKILRYARSQGGSPDATCVYYGDKTNIYNASLVNTAFCHGVQGSVVIPAALAMAEKNLENGHELITAVVVAWEAMLRLAASISTGVSHKRPLNPVSTFGPFSAAIAGGKILHLNDSSMEDAITCCPAQAAGTMQSTAGDCESARVASGFAASYGLRAASMASRGISGARDMLEGKAGFLMCIAGLYSDGTPKFDVSRINDEFGRRWHVTELLSELKGSKTETDFRKHATLAMITRARQNRFVEVVRNIEDQNDMCSLMSSLVRTQGEDL